MNLAIKYYEKAIELENSNAMFNLGILCIKGEIVQKDVKKAIELFKKAAKLKDVESMNRLAVMYEIGEHGLEKDIKKCVCYLKESSDLDNLFAINKLALIYNKGEVVEKNVHRAIELFEKGVKLGDTVSMNNLSLIYQKEPEFRNIEKAIKLLNDSIKMGNINALYKLGFIYFFGDGVKKDVERGISLFEKVVKTKHVPTIHFMGDIYLKGRDVEINYDKSLDYFFLAFKLSEGSDKGYFREQVKIILMQRKVEWKTDYHPYWHAEKNLNSQILALLLISKHRVECSFKQTRYLVKGLVMKVVKFICHFEQIICLET